MCCGWQRAGAQSLQAFQAQVMGHRFVLRDFSAEQDVTYEWTNDTLVGRPQRALTFAIFSPEAVQMNGHVLTIKGVRHTALLDRTTQAFSLTRTSIPVRIKVDLKGSDPATVLPRLADSLFFSLMKPALEALPVEVRDQIPMDPQRLREILQPGSVASKKQEPQWVEVAGVWRSVPRDEVTLPRNNRLGEIKPEVGPNFLGYVICLLVVTEKGFVGQRWVEAEEGKHLEDPTLRVTQRYLFTPALYQGKAVGTVLTTIVSAQ